MLLAYALLTMFEHNLDWLTPYEHFEFPPPISENVVTSLYVKRNSVTSDKLQPLSVSTLSTEALCVFQKGGCGGGKMGKEGTGIFIFLSLTSSFDSLVRSSILNPPTPILPSPLHASSSSCHHPPLSHPLHPHPPALGGKRRE